MCTSVKGEGYVPNGITVEGADVRNWYGETPRLQRALAEMLLPVGKTGMTYRALMDKMQENEMPVNRTTLISALKKRNDVFIIEKNGPVYTVRLVPNLTSSRAIRLAIPDKGTKFSDRYPQVVQKIIDYLWGQSDYTAPQSLLAELFGKEIPNVKSGNPVIRKIMNDTDYFVKTLAGKGSARNVSLSPVLVEKLRLERKESEPVQADSPRPAVVLYDYAALKESIVRHNAKFFESVITVDDLPSHIDEMVGIMMNGKKEMAPNSVFAREKVLVKMYKYYCLETAPGERDDLRLSLLTTAECYLKNFSFLIRGKEYAENENLGFVINDLKDYGDIPTWRSCPTSDYDKYGNEVSNIANKTVRPQRNTLMAHADNALNMSDSVAIQGIEGCVRLFLHLAYRLVKSGKSAIW